MEFVANFLLNNDSLDAEFDVSEVQNFDALFEIYAGGVTWGNISGDIENQTDLQNELNTLSGAIDSNHQAIMEINTTMQGYGDIVTHDVSEFATSAQGAKADSALQPNDNITELNNNAGYITSAAIGDGTLTIQVNNETVGTFTANQSGNTTANIEVPDSATWGNITGDIEDQTDLTTVLASKQDVLTPGTDIEITQDNTINFTNASGYITGINSTDVTNALGYTPYDAANPDKFLKNTATGTNSITVNGTAATSSQAINIGKGSSATKSNTVALGYNASAAGSSSVAIGNSAGASTAGISGVAIGDGAKSQAQYAIQLGKGTNPVASTLSIGFGSNNYTLLTGSNGLIPNGRLSTGIARTSDMNAADNNLQAQIDVLKARGRFLALWNCATGLAETNPTSSPYTYQTGDYFIIGVVSTATPAVNYRPDGSSYTTGVASTTVETAAVDVDDVYYYDGTTWHLQINTQKTTAFVNIAGSPYDNTELAQALNSKADDSDITNLETEISAKQDALTPGTDIEITQNNTINFINSSGYITGITSSDVTTALGYTPYNSSNPDGYTDNVGTVTSVNNVQPDANGNVTIPTGGTVDQTYDGTSANAQSGVAIAGAKFLQNTATGSSALTIGGTPSGYTSGTNIGVSSQAKQNYGTALGFNTNANGNSSTCIGRNAGTSAASAIQIGAGINSTANTLQVGFIHASTNYQLLDGTTGLIPDARISNNIARTSAIPTSSTVASWGFITGINSSDVITALGYTPYNSSNPNGYITGINSSDVTTALGYTPVNPSNLATVATSGSYNDLSNKPEIYSRNIGEIVTSTIPLTDAGLHLLDGSLIQGSGSYSAFVDYIAGLTSDYPDLFDTEANWQQSVNDYGVCGKFVYDSVNNTVRLPKITGVVEGTTDLTALGDLIEAGLPNITGTMDSSVGYGTVWSGAFEGTHGQGKNTTSNGSPWEYDSTTFDASRSSSIYGNSATVQPQAIKVLYYIVIATTTKTNIQVDIDEIATDLNGKADVDLSNCTVLTDVIVPISYTSGTSGGTNVNNGTYWVMRYSNGWVRMGGHFTSGATTDVTVNLPVTMANANYSWNAGYEAGSSNMYGQATAKTTTSITFKCYKNNGLSWIVEGMGA